MNIVSSFDELGHYMFEQALAPYFAILDAGAYVMLLVSNYVSYIHYYIFLMYVYTGNFIFTNSFFGNYLVQIFGPDVISFKINVEDITYNSFLNVLNMDSNSLTNILGNYFKNTTPHDFIFLPYFGNSLFLEESEDIFDNAFLSNFNDFFSNFEIFLNSQVFNSIFNIIFNIFFSFIFLFYFTLFIIELIISEYRLFMASRKNLDIENLSNQLAIESEKEVASFDDILPLFLAVFLTLGWFFWSNSIFALSTHCNFYLFIQLIVPCFIFITFLCPLFVLYDFGIFFFIYLRGSGTTSALAAEILYDMINLFSYYVRIMIQTSRLVLMITALGSYQEYIDAAGIYPFAFLLNDSLINFLLNPYYFNFSILDYFLKVLVVILYILYEVFHTFFVTTIQTIAFFAMVFWLFFYLFTFFVSEQAENLFEKKRKLYQ